MSVDALATLAKEIQTTLRRIAANRDGKTGRYSKEIERACSLDLVGFAAGSVRLGFELATPPDDQKTLWPDAGRDSLVRFVEALGAGEAGQAGWAAGLSSAAIDGLDRITRPLDDGIASIEFNLDTFDPAIPPRSVRVTRRFRERVRSAPASPSQPGTVRVVGVIWEADWKKHTAELHEPDGHVVRIEFDAERDEEITEARRMTVGVTGTSVAPVNAGARPRVVRLDRLEVIDTTPLEQPGDAADFWETPTVAQLAERQQVEPIADLNALAGDWPDGDSLDEFLETVHKGRH